MLYAGLLTLWYIYLTVRVVMARRKYRVPFGVSDQHPDLVRAVRAHGNFQEYTPLFLILLYLEESTAHTEWACYFLGALFLAGRLAHSYSILVAEPEGIAAGKGVGYTLRFRFYAMLHTFFPLGILAMMLLVQWCLNKLV